MIYISDWPGLLAMYYQKEHFPWKWTTLSPLKIRAKSLERADSFYIFNIFCRLIGQCRKQTVIGGLLKPLFTGFQLSVYVVVVVGV